MAYNSLDSKIWVRGSDSATVSVATSSTTIANATSAVAASNNYPIRKYLSITNVGTKDVFIGIGRVPTTTDYDFALINPTGSADSSFTVGGSLIFDSSVPQDQINAIGASTGSVAVVVGV